MFRINNLNLESICIKVVQNVNNEVEVPKKCTPLHYLSICTKLQFTTAPLLS